MTDHSNDTGPPVPEDGDPGPQQPDDGLESGVSRDDEPTPPVGGTVGPSLGGLNEGGVPDSSDAPPAGGLKIKSGGGIPVGDGCDIFIENSGITPDLKEDMDEIARKVKERIDLEAAAG